MASVWSVDRVDLKLEQLEGATSKTETLYVHVFLSRFACVWRKWDFAGSGMRGNGAACIPNQLKGLIS
jgi:hypothetical protein